MSNRTLGIGALVIVLATFAASFLHRDGLHSNPQFLSVFTLAKAIKNRERIVLVDLRSDSVYRQLHIPTAKNVTLSGLDSLVLQPDYQLIIYSGVDMLARQAWNSMSEDRRSVTKVVYGGMGDWYDYILYPTLPLHPQAQHQELIRQVKELSSFYGGQPEFTDQRVQMEGYYVDPDQSEWPEITADHAFVRKGC